MCFNVQHIVRLIAVVLYEGTVDMQMWDFRQIVSVES